MGGSQAYMSETEILMFKWLGSEIFSIKKLVFDHFYIFYNTF